MEHNVILFHIFLIFTGAAVLSTVVLYTRQSLLVAYIFLGMFLGPWGLKLIPNAAIASQVGDIGIIFLLFLLGVELDPRDLWRMLLKISWIAGISSVIFFLVSVIMSYCFFGLTLNESILVGAAMMFSSTIIGLKLLPRITLHHQRIGEVMVSILLLQDLIAIAAMILIHGMQASRPFWQDMGLVLITLPSILLVAFLGERFILRVLFKRFEHVQEYVFLVAIAWCLAIAKLASLFGLSEEIGAFIAGVAIAEGPIAHYIESTLRPLRDFCLVMFFFAIGATFNLTELPQVLLPAVLLSLLLIVLKPWIFKFLLKKAGESSIVAEEAGVRLGQGSEFSLLLGAMAFSALPDIISPKAFYLIEATTILTFIASCYWVALKYPTPMAFTRKLQKD